MDNRLEKIETKIDKLDERLDKIDITLTKQHGSLDHHIKRTALAEENIEMLRSEIKPLAQHVATINHLAKIVSVMGTFAAIYAYLFKK